MAVPHSVDPAAWLAEQIQASDPDLLRSMVKTMAEAPVSAEADARCGAAYGERSSKRTNHRNGYRMREWDTRAGTIELAIPKLRTGSYFPDWLLGRRRRAEQALISVVVRQLPAGSLHPAGGQTGRAAGHHRYLQKPGLGHDHGAQSAGRSLPHPALG